MIELKKFTLRSLIIALTLHLILPVTYAESNDRGYVVPVRTIHRGEILRPDMLASYDLTIAPQHADAYHRTIAIVAGQMATQQLSAFRPIPINSTSAGPIIAPGRPVQLRFRKGDVTIEASGIALQTGVTGTRIRAKNQDSGIIVNGIVGSDGAVEVQAP